MYSIEELQQASIYDIHVRFNVEDGSGDLESKNGAYSDDMFFGRKWVQNGIGNYLTYNGGHGDVLLLNYCFVLQIESYRAVKS